MLKAQLSRFLNKKDLSFILDDAYYRKVHKIDVKDTFKHFKKYGFDLNLNPSPIVDIKFIKIKYSIESYSSFVDLIEKDSDRLSEYFDPIQYFEFNPDVKSSGLAAIKHMMIYGIKESRKFHSSSRINYNSLKNGAENIPAYKLHQRKSEPVDKLPSFKDDWDNSYIENHYFKAKASKKINRDFEPLQTQKRVLIIGELSLVQCKKYRILQKIEMLKELGIKCDFSHWLDVPRCLNYLQTCSSVIFYRVPFTKITNSLLNESRRLGLSIGYDIDDPIFDITTYANNINLDYLDQKEKIGILSSSSSYESMLIACDYVITSTPELQGKIKSLADQEVYLWRNMIDSESLNVVNYINEFSYRKKKDDTIFRIGYMSGSRAHEADFKTAIFAIEKILIEFNHVHVYVHGHAQLAVELSMRYPDRIQIKKFSDYYTYLESFESLDLNIIPLVSDDFNNCKSAIRYLEASLFNVPTIVTYIGDFKNIINEDKNGYFVRDNSEWYDKLKFAITSKNEIQKVGASANKYVLDNFVLRNSTETISKDLIETL